jgi:peptidyl-prolyl cis-trans isomerase D
MATLEKLRNRAGTLVAVVIGLALLAFILGDFFGSGGSLFTQNQFEIVEISGKSLPFQLYQERVDQITELNKASRRQTSLDEQTIENIREEVWSALVQENVLGGKYKNLGIDISTDELTDMVQGRNLHPIIRQEFGNPQTGQVDPAMVAQFLRSLDNDPSGLQRSIWLYLENLIIRDRLFTKYNNLIKKGMYVTDFHSKQSVSERSRRVDFKYIVGRYASIDDSLVSINDSEISSYYKENKHNYLQEASRDLEYVVFPIVPSTQDFTQAEEWINEIKDDFIQAADPIQFTNLNSDTPFRNQFFKQGDLSSQELNDWAFNAKEDDYIGPLFDGESYLIARLVNIAFLPDSVKARHILISSQVEAQNQLDAVKSKADSLFQVAKKGGNFARLATEYSDDPGSAAQGGDLGWFPEGVMVKPFNDACFNGKRGEIVMVETQFGFHIIEILDLGKPSKKVQVAMLERNVIPSTKSYQNIYQAASEFAGMYTTSEAFDQGVQEKKLSKRIASNLKELDSRVAGLEHPREMVRWAYRSEENEVSPVFEFGDNFVVASLKRVREKGVAPLASVKDQIRNEVIADKKADILMDKLTLAMAEENSIEGLSNELSMPLQSAERISFSSFSLPSAGFEPAVISAAVYSPEGEISGPIKGNAGVYAVSVKAINFEEGDELGEKKRILSLYQSRSMREAYEAIKENANIVDKRSKFF